MDNLSFGLSVMVIGFTVVCITLLLLYLMFHYFGYYFEYSKKQKDIKEKAREEKFPEVMKSEKKEFPKEEMEKLEEEKIPGEVVAVIASVIASYDVRPGYRFKVKRVKREKSISPWIITGRKDAINVYGRDII